MIQYAILLLAIPLGILLAKQTRDEKEIYTKKIYFPAIEKTLLVLILIFAILKNSHITLTLTFILITILVWHKN
jgi:hypothetical protein